MHNTGNLHSTPALCNVKRDDAIWNIVRDRICGCTVNALTQFSSIFNCTGDAHAVTQRCCVSELVHAAVCWVLRGELDSRKTGCSKRGGTTSEETAELDESFRTGEAGLQVAVTSGAAVTEELATTWLRTGVIVAAGRADPVDACKGTQHAVFGAVTCIEEDAQFSVAVDCIVLLTPHGGAVTVSLDRTANAQAGGGAGDVEEAWAVGWADFDVFQ